MCFGCCVASCITGCCRACSDSCCGSSKTGGSLCARIHSLSFLIFGTVVAFLLEVFSEKFNNWPYGTNYGACPAATLALCLSKELALRICFGMSVFFFVMFLLSLGAIRKTGGPFVFIQTNGWGLKGFFFIAALVASYFLPPGFAPVWIWFCQFGGGFFLLAQVVVLLDFAHNWNKSWVEKEWLAGLIIASCVLGAAWLVEVICMYVFWHPCGLNNVLTTVCAALCLILLALALRVPRGSLLEVSLVGAYCAYLCISSYLSQPSEWQCLAYVNTSTTESAWSAIIGFLITLAALGYSSFSTASTLSEADAGATGASSSSSASAGALPSEGPAPEKSGDNYKKVEEGRAGDDADEPEADPDAEYYPYWRFHLVMFLATLYVGCLLTGWSLGDNSTQALSVGSGVVSMWIKQATQWAVMLLYLWTLVAPYILVNREFD